MATPEEERAAAERLGTLASQVNRAGYWGTSRADEETVLTGARTDAWKKRAALVGILSVVTTFVLVAAVLILRARQRHPWTDTVPAYPEAPPPVPETNEPVSPREPREPRVIGASSPGPIALLTFVCTPACDQILDNGQPLGPGNIFNRPIRAGRHSFLATTANGGRKLIVADIVADERKEIRIVMGD